MTPLRDPVLAAVLLAACAGTPELPALPETPPGHSTVYTCADGYRFSARVRSDSVVVALPESTVTLPPVRSASGAKYVSAGTTFWSRGELATLETPDGSRPDCRGRPAATPWEEAALLGVEFRAVGQEPGWLLDIDEGRWLRYVGDYGSTRAFAPAPRRDSAGGTVTYRARSEGRELTVEIREAPCRDVMSGEAYSHTVTVRLDTSEVHGCGRQPGLGASTDRYWTLTELEGRPAIAGEAGREAHLRLSEHGQRMAGSTGCNSLSGQYRQDGDRLRFGPIVTTLMACADTALAAQEREFLGMLELVDRSVVAGDEVTLYDGDRVVARFTAGRPE